MSLPKHDDATTTLYCEIGGLQVDVTHDDLEPAGLFVRTTTPPPVDTEVDVFLRSSAGMITLRAHVVQVVDVQRAAREHRVPGFGVLFAHVSSQARAWIERTVAQAPRKRPDASTPRPSASLSPAPLAARAGIAERPSPSVPRPAGPAVAKVDSRDGLVSASPRPAPPVNVAPSEARTPRPDRPPHAALRAAATLAVLERELESARAKSPELLLGLDKEAGAAAARDAFLDASRRYHPHRFARYESDAITRVATELFVIYKRAYGALAPPASRPKRSDSGPLNV
jgi:hypothetical protein